MNPLKKGILNFLTTQRIRKISTREIRGYLEASTIGIIINVNDNQSHVDHLVSSIRLEGKTPVVINVDPSGIKQGKNDFPSVGKKDISFFGAFKSQHLIHFLSKNYDFLLVLDHQVDTIIKYIAANCRTACRVGFDEYPNDFLDLQIKPDKKRELEDVLKYMRMISNG